MPDADEQLLGAHEPRVLRAVERALAHVAEQFTTRVINPHLADGRPFTAADGALLAEQWRAVIPWILDAAEAVYRAAVERIAALFGTVIDVPRRVTEYLRAAENRLVLVGEDMWATARAVIADATIAGASIAQIARTLTEAFADGGIEVSNARAVRIARTETIGAWNAGKFDAATALPEDLRPAGKTWRATHDLRTRDAHADADGQTVPLGSTFIVGGELLRYPGDPIGAPGNVINCFPGSTPVVAPSGVRRVYRRWYEGPLVKIRTLGGVELSATPNHPLLTPHGWVAAQDVQVGEHLVGSPVAEWVGRGDPDVEDAPATFEEIYAATLKAGEQPRVVRGGVDFHGDVVEGEVEVVTVDPFLDLVVATVDQATPSEGLDEQELVGLHGGQRLRSCPSGGVGGGPSVVVQAGSRVAGSRSTPGLVGSRGEALALLKRRVSHPDRHGSPTPARGDTSGEQSAADGRPTDPEAVREALLGFAGEVTRYEVVDVDVCAFSGHVFNLETVDGWYIANCIASSNCRCTLTFGEQDVSAAARNEERGIVRDTVSAAAGDPEHTSGMVALLPSAVDAGRLALDGYEQPGELHVTLAFLGPSEEWSEEQRSALVDALTAAGLGGPVEADAFGVNHWNPNGEDPCWVYAISGPDLSAVRSAAWGVLDDADTPQIPENHTPWVPHLTGAYTTDSAVLDLMVDRLGPVTFDRVVVAFGDETTEIPLTDGGEAAVTADATGTEPRRWSTPGDTALAFEDDQTGDGRIFAPGALYWEGDSWPLQYAEQMNGGHAGAELGGAIEVMMRVGSRIAGAGSLYPDVPAGAKSIGLLEREAPLGVSVDLDDVDVEVVNTRPEEDDGDDDDGVVLLASLSSLSVLALGEGRWLLRGGELREHTAAGIEVDGTSLLSLLSSAGVTASAGDSDDPDDGEVLFEERSGDFVMRVTRARVRGATLVSMPAFARARVVLNAEAVDDDVAADGGGTLIDRVVSFVSTAATAQTAEQVADAVGIEVEQARGALSRAVEAGRLTRAARGLYTGVSALPEGDEETVAASGAVPLPTDNDDDMAAFASVVPPMELEASAWTEFQGMPAMPAAWFAEPTRDQLGAEDGGFHYDNGRVYGWVAQKGVCHDGYTNQCLRIDDFGRFDLTTFLRARIDLDNGDEVAVGVFTMNTGHANDGSNVRAMQRQFDDSRTVAGIVTVGLNERGLWFSGAAAPWLSEWDLAVFNTCRPSGHWKQERNGRWSLRAVLSVPVPGYPNRLAASAFINRSNMALAASAGVEMTEEFGTDELVASAVPTDGETWRALACAVVDEIEARAEARRLVEELAAEIDDVRRGQAEALRHQITQEA